MRKGALERQVRRPDDDLDRAHGGVTRQFQGLATRQGGQEGQERGAPHWDSSHHQTSGSQPGQSPMRGSVSG